MKIEDAISEKIFEKHISDIGFHLKYTVAKFNNKKSSKINTASEEVSDMQS
jgi:hypothetical protein